MVSCDNCRDRIYQLFKDYDDSVLYSYFEGRSGKGFMSTGDKLAAVIIGGDFYFVAGDSSLAPKAAALAKGNSEAVFMPVSEDWIPALIRADRTLTVDRRYRTAVSEKGFDTAKLNAMKSKIESFENYELKPIDKGLYQQAMSEKWSEAFVFNFENYDDYNKNGFGFGITENGRLICAASTYSVYSKGIEVEIATRESFRRQGLATVAGAALIEECVKRGLRPHWDAANLISLAIARKMGFILKEEYSVIKRTNA